MVATTLRECRLVRNSRNQIPCHVPVASLPFEMGIFTDVPTRADLIWACLSKHLQQELNWRTTNRHIVLALGRVSIQIPLAIRRGNAVQRVTHVSADIVVPVFVQREGAASVLDEEMEHADLVIAELGEFGDNMVGDEVGAAGAGGEGEGLLEPGHCGGGSRD